MVTGKPCAVVVTSGTAVAELLPAVVEAYYQARPLVLLTADRPEHFRGVERRKLSSRWGYLRDMREVIGKHGMAKVRCM